MKCDNCRKEFPVNPDKHPRDDFLYCPWCGQSVKNPFKMSILPSVNLNFIKEKLDSISRDREVNRFLKTYRFKWMNPATGKEVVKFSINEWKNGRRPAVRISEIMDVVGKNASRIAVETEIERLEKFGIKVQDKDTYIRGVPS